MNPKLLRPWNFKRMKSFKGKKCFYLPRVVTKGSIGVGCVVTINEEPWKPVSELTIVEVKCGAIAENVPFSDLYPCGNAKKES